MSEHEMEELIALFPDEFFPGRAFVLKGRQNSFAGVGRFDLLFQDQHGTNILVELKARPAKAEDIDQLVKYRDALKDRGEKRVLMCLVAPRIPPTIRELLEDFGIDHAEIHQAQFREVADRHGISPSPELRADSMAGGQAISARQDPWQRDTGTTTVQKGWYYWADQNGKGYFLAFVNQKGSCSMRRFDAQTGAFLGKEYDSGKYQAAFQEFVASSIPLALSHQPNLERTCRERLPDEALLELRGQVGSVGSRGEARPGLEKEEGDIPRKKLSTLLRSEPNVRGTTAKVEKGWHYWVDPNGRPLFLAFVNAKGSCSVRFFDAESGRFLGKQYKSGDFEEAFRAYLVSGPSLHLSRQPNLEKECKKRLPDPVLAELRRQVPRPSRDPVP
jgi:hypothetical protein